MTKSEPPDPDALRLERRFNAPAKAIFDTWTSAELLRRWWPAGSDSETPIAEVDPRVGGELWLVMRSPEGDEFGGSGQYLEIDPPERLVFTRTWHGHEGHGGRSSSRSSFASRRTGPPP